MSPAGWFFLGAIVMGLVWAAVEVSDRAIARHLERARHSARQADEDVKFFKALVPDADREQLEATVEYLASENADLQGKLADREVEVTALRMELGRQICGNVVELRPPPSTRGGAS